jgi:tetratricopeptide (TPR) repeat protein
MYCHKCGKQNNTGSKFCKYCGVKFDGVDEKKELENVEHSTASHHTEKKKSSIWGKVITAVVILLILGGGIYGSVDKEPIATNNEALTNFDTGDSESAIMKFRQAADEATTDEIKVAALKNLGYVYSTEGQTTQALSAFNEALPLTTQDTFDFYLISGEVALLDGNVNDALTNYNSAYRLNPEDFQINNALALFHMDLEEVAPRYVDYNKALLYAKKANELSPSEISKQNLAIAHYFNDNYNDTISLLSTSNFSQHPYAAYWLGLAYLSIEDDANAKTYLQMAIDNGAEVPQEIIDYLNSN